MFKNLFMMVCLLAATQAHAQLIRNFTPRYSIDTKGRLVFVSNNIITTKQRSGGLATAYTQAPPACPGSTFLCKNDGEHCSNIDIDGDNSTFNSSAATLVLPTCSSVEFAGLYWGAGIAIGQGSNGTAPMSAGGWNQVKLKAPGGGYQTITANAVDTVNVTFHGYQSFADITNLVKAQGGGLYTIANVKCDSVNSSSQPMVNAYGGWNLVVVYRDSTQPLRNLTVFDGMAVVRDATGFGTREITVSGFRCPPTGNVNAKFGMVVYDGDRGATDGFLMRQNATGTFTNQTAAGESAATTSGASDAWNSSITDTGSLITSRIPAHQNTYGYDAHIFKLNNAGFKYLRNNDNTAVMRISTTSEGYVLGLVTSEIDTYEPEMILENSLQNLNGPVLEKGDTLLITGTVKNTGTDAAVNVTATDNLPAYFKYVPGSLTYNSLPRTDATGDDEAHYNAATRAVVVNIGSGSTAATGGSVAPNSAATYNFSYKLTVSDNCVDIGVTPIALLQKSNLSYLGLASAATGAADSRPLSNNGCINPAAPDTAFLLTGCETVLPVKIISFSGSKTGAGNVLRWKTEEMQDVAAYELEWSTNGRDFSRKYGYNVNARSGTFSAAYTDADATGFPVSYYRLKVIRLDGKELLSSTVIIRNTDKEDAAEFSLSPNPAPATAELKLFSSEEIQQLQWYDAHGRLVKTIQSPRSGNSIRSSGLAPGVYYVKAHFKNKISTSKLVIY